MTDINWRELDLTSNAGEQTINRIIADRLGFRYSYDSETQYLDVFMGNRKTNGWVCDTQSVDSFLRISVIHYCTDLNAAIQLQHEGYKLKLEQWQNNQRWEWLATYYSNTLAKGTGVWNLNPATAICLAWLEVGDQ